jgi:hypothetical protein
MAQLQQQQQQKGVGDSSTMSQSYVSQADPSLVDTLYNGMKSFLSNNAEFIQNNPHANIGAKEDCRIINGFMYIPVVGVTKIGSAARFLGTLMNSFRTRDVDWHQANDLTGSASKLEVRVPLSAAIAAQASGVAGAAGIWADLSNPRNLLVILGIVLLAMFVLNFALDVPREDKLQMVDSTWSWFMSWMPWNWFRGGRGGTPRPPSPSPEDPNRIQLNDEDLKAILELREKRKHAEDLPGVKEDAKKMPRGQPPHLQQQQQQ